MGNEASNATNPCPKCNGPTVVKWTRKNKSRRECKSCRSAFTIYKTLENQSAALSSAIASDQPTIESFQSEVRVILSKFKEFEKLPSNTVESMLLTHAIKQMMDPFVNGAAKASAREYISEQAKIHSVATETEATISFVDPSMMGVLKENEDDNI